MNENDFWFYAKTLSPTNPVEHKICFDMRTMFYWEGVKTLKNEPMIYKIYLSFRPNEPVILTATDFDSFAIVWKKYVEAT